MQLAPEYAREVVRFVKRMLEENNLSDAAVELERLVGEIITRYDPLLVVIAGSLARRESVRGLSDIDMLVVVECVVDKLERF